MTRPPDARKTAGTLATFGLAGVAAVAALWYFNAPARAPRTGAPPAASTAAAVPITSFAGPGQPASAAPPLPASLQGTAPPPLPVDARGHLRQVRGVRDFFDYFLAAEQALTAPELDALIRKQIAAQLDGTTAQPEALDVWRRYTAYRQALARLAPLSSAPPAGGIDLDAMQALLDSRASLASRTLGADWGEAFFGADWRRGRYTIERLRIAQDRTLTEAQKAVRLQALEETLPPGERDSLDADRRERASVAKVAELEQQGTSIDQLRAKATQALGPQAAERIVKVRQDDEAWRAKYADYAAQRARIEAMGASQAERDAQIDELRRRVFSNPAQALRAASLDQAAGH